MKTKFNMKIYKILFLFGFYFFMFNFSVNAMLNKVVSDYTARIQGLKSDFFQENKK